MPYNLLSEPIRRYVRDKRWDAFRPIQAAAIKAILSDDRNYILSSRTASGKTEAAFLPILSKVDFKKPGVAVLYVSPLVALINDQFDRVEDLCKYLDIPVTKWHGEANRSLKKHLIEDPKGVVLITPESIEAMFVNAPFNVRKLFQNLQYVVIDEVHAFIGSDRGIQLRSILNRLRRINTDRFNIVGLSATLGDFNEARKLTSEPENTVILRDKSPKIVEATFRHFDSDGAGLPLDLMKDLYRNVSNRKTLIFPNNRGRTEEVSVKLGKIAEKVGGHLNYFSHHSSVDKLEREYVERFAKQSKGQNFSISCTSTLELGIDIGAVDLVVQIDATFSIASLVQRIGRSGRRDGDKSQLILYSTNPWSLLQALASWSLYREEKIESFNISEKAYDILLHQLLSIVKSNSGIEIEELVLQLTSNRAFAAIQENEIYEIISHCVEEDLLEIIRSELIIGLGGEKLVNNYDFYSVFSTEPYLHVMEKGRKVGEIPFSPMIFPGENILLAARIWKIVDVDESVSKIEVVPANDGKSPIFYGSGGVVHCMVRQRMWDIIKSDVPIMNIADDCKRIIQELRDEFEHNHFDETFVDRPVFVSEEGIVFYTFCGTRINRTISVVLENLGFLHELNENSSGFKVFDNKVSISELVILVLNAINNIDSVLSDVIHRNPKILMFSKWGQYLPVKFKIEIVKCNYLDVDGTINFLKARKL
ncbi:DEAD/DEAH box helicase [Chitinophaga deserti]|uniref:DEAD/DEAH box helicase n=1 Tax=Chitinophaga deserti TaxID=2164099 RepID=UPI000D6D5C9B|nr:DEAD/DEAH box helicase [Chitinophaga deserti]